MTKAIKYFALATLAVAAGSVYADNAETQGGLRIRTEDGRFEANLGGRIHFDGNLIETDKDAPFGSAGTQNDGFFFRRVYLTVSGKAWDWNYKIEPDFASNNGTGGAQISFQDVYLSHVVGPGELVFGQIKPPRGLEELTSSNDILMIERPYASAAGLFNGGVSREFQPGIYYRGTFLDKGTFGTGGYSLRRENVASNQGAGGSARVTFAPILTDNLVVHAGASYSYEAQDGKGASDSGLTAPGLNPGAIGTNLRYLSRRGPTLLLGQATGSTRVAQTVGAELAAKFGPAFVQAEYMTQELDQRAGGGAAAGGADQYVNAWYVQGSYFVTGESKGYKKAVGVFSSGIKPNHAFGAFEVKARYDQADNIANVISGQTYGHAKVDEITVGVNYYVNPNVRFMLEYSDAEAKRRVSATGVTQKDEPSAFAARAQFAF